MQVEFGDEAAAELDETHAWYQEKSPAAARGFLDEVQAALRIVGQDPLRWPAFEADTHRFVLRRFPYVLVYQVRDDRVRVVAVAHSKRRPGYWRSRK